MQSNQIKATSWKRLLALAATAGLAAALGAPAGAAVRPSSGTVLLDDAPSAPDQAKPADAGQSSDEAVLQRMRAAREAENRRSASANEAKGRDSSGNTERRETAPKREGARNHEGAANRESATNREGPARREQAQGHEEVARPEPAGRGGETFLGIGVSPAPAVLTRQLGQPDDEGLVVDQVMPGSAAGKAGVQQYDLIRKLDDQLLVDGRQLEVLVRAHKPGDTVKLDVIRKGKPIELTVKLGEEGAARERQAEPARGERTVEPARGARTVEPAHGEKSVEPSHAQRGGGDQQSANPSASDEDQAHVRALTAQLQALREQAARLRAQADAEDRDAASAPPSANQGDRGGSNNGGGDR